MPFSNNRFQDFFVDKKYISIKNILYNYLLRKRKIQKFIDSAKCDPILEFGCGLSPMITENRPVVYLDLSFSALLELRSKQIAGWYIVADGNHLPLKDGSFLQVICSEVLEHTQDDKGALKEIARVMKKTGSLILTFPHRHFYYSSDDRYVGHIRRYELTEISDSLKVVGLKIDVVEKVLGPLEKITMMLVVWVYALLTRFKPKSLVSLMIKNQSMLLFLLAWINRLYGLIVRLDAFIMPCKLSTVLLVKAIKRTVGK